jgi:hypothetical protein
VRGYNVSGWSFQRYGAAVTAQVDDWSGGIIAATFNYGIYMATMDNWNVQGRRKTVLFLLLFLFPLRSLLTSFPFSSL